MAAAAPVTEVELTFVRFTEAGRSAWIASALTVLSPAERAQAAAIPDRDVRAQHVIGRAVMRMTASRLGDHPPGEVRITRSADGKPQLPDTPSLHVNVAHTRRTVVVAACTCAPVGVDIEDVLAQVADPRRLAERVFTEAERASLRDVPQAALAEWFSSVWTIKEAVGKALGVGVIPALSGVSVERRADGFVLADVWSGPPVEQWSLHQLHAPGGEEKIAVAVPAPGVRLGTPRSLSLESFSSACATDWRGRSR